MGKTNVVDVKEKVFSDRVALAAAVGFTPRQLFYVNSALGSTNYPGTDPDQPKATLAQALALCSSSLGDCVIVAAGHAETLSTTTQGIDISKSGVTIVGQGNARNKPAFTAGAADVVGVLISGSNNRLQNLRFIGSTSQATATSSLMSLTGTDNRVEHCVFEHGGAGPLVAVLLAAAHRSVFNNCRWLGTAAGPDMGLKGTASASNDIIITNCIFNYASINVDSAAIGTLAGGGFPGAIIQDVAILGANSSAIRNLGSYAATVPDGIINRVYVTSNTGITMGAAMPFDCGGLSIGDCYWSDAVAVQGLWFGAQYVALISNASKAPWGTGGPT